MRGMMAALFFCMSTLCHRWAPTKTNNCSPMSTMHGHYVKDTYLHTYMYIFAVSAAKSLSQFNVTHAFSSQDFLPFLAKQRKQKVDQSIPKWSMTLIQRHTDIQTYIHPHIGALKHLLSPHSAHNVRLNDFYELLIVEEYTYLHMCVYVLM